MACKDLRHIKCEYANKKNPAGNNKEEGSRSLAMITTAPKVK
jgi:hypothetical protein